MRANINILDAPHGYVGMLCLRSFNEGFTLEPSSDSKKKGLQAFICGTSICQLNKVTCGHASKMTKEHVLGGNERKSFEFHSLS